MSQPEPDLDPEELSHREAKVAEAQARIFPKWYDKPIAEEDAAQPSKALKAVLKRKWHISGHDPEAKREEA